MVFPDDQKQWFGEQGFDRNPMLLHGERHHRQVQIAIDDGTHEVAPKILLSID